MPCRDMKKWNELSMAEKAKYIQLGVKHGITEVSSIRDTYNLYANGGDKANTQSKTDTRRVNFDKVRKANINRGRDIPVEAIEQFQDSLLARGYGLPQRLAILATSMQELDAKEGAASVGVGGNGYLGLSYGRMGKEYLDDSIEGRGKQINFLIEDLNKTHSNNWLDGGSGGPKIMSGKDGFNQFWNADDIELATRILNKSYIRPAGKEASWNNRARIAKNLVEYLE